MKLDDLTVGEVKQTFMKLGFKCLNTHHKNAKGADLTVIKNNNAYTVEIKCTRYTKRKSLQVSPVECRRKNDDLIAIVLPSRYILVEPMEQHLKNCSTKGLG